MDSAKAIIDEVKAAFPARRYRNEFPLVNSTMGSEPFDVEAEFKDKLDWTSLDPTWLDLVPNGLSSALSFLSDEAVCFYIPAFLVADLKGLLKRADPTFALIHGFYKRSRNELINPRLYGDKTWVEYGAERWRHLTLPQVLAVVHYLEWQIEKDGIFLQAETREALETYWYERANPSPRT
jgi:hypothetical protein